MKKILLFITILFTSLSYSQSEPISYDSIIEFDSIQKDLLFSKAQEYIAIKFNSAQDVIQMVDKEEGTLVIKGLFVFDNHPMKYSNLDGVVNFTIKIYTKDNKYKVNILDFIHEARKFPQFSSHKIYTDTPEYKGASSKVNTVAYNLLLEECVDFKDRFLSELEDYVNNGSESTDW